VKNIFLGALHPISEMGGDDPVPVYLALDPLERFATLTIGRVHKIVDGVQANCILPVSIVLTDDKEKRWRFGNHRPIVDTDRPFRSVNMEDNEIRIQHTQPGVDLIGHIQRYEP
jgi:hypothetical protein